MNINELKQQINRVIGVKGDLRVQAWWMNKLLTDILVYCDGRDNSKDISDVKTFFLNELKNLETALVDVIEKSENDLAESINTTESDLNERIDLLESNGLPANLVNITYSELKSLRDNGKLVPGQQYRITDYKTTTTQENTTSAGHQFDIIVTADDIHVLNETARATYNDKDTYFSDFFAPTDLNAWELKYCIDNDAERFAWADATNGRGVIYYMKDEWGNECPYDFKNIQFARWELSNPVGYANDEKNNWVQESTPLDSLKMGFYGLTGSDNVFYHGCYDYKKNNRYKVEYTISESPTYFYTFGNSSDFSKGGNNYGNVIKEYKVDGKIQLNNIVFTARTCYSNRFGYGCHSNTFSDSCYSNNFGNNCYSNSFNTYCYSNNFGNNCYSSSFGDECHSNTFGNDCYQNSFGSWSNYNMFERDCNYNVFGQSCDYNSFGTSCACNIFRGGCGSNRFDRGCSYNDFYNYCSDNIFKQDCSRNSFGSHCTSNSFAQQCDNNSFGNHCYENNFGQSCTSNSFANDCYKNNFGQACGSNKFGQSCDYNSLGSYCNVNIFGQYCVCNSLGTNCVYINFGESKDNLKSYYRYIIFDNGNKYINLNCISETSDLNYFQNVRVGLGVNNTSTYKTIEDSNVGQTFETLYKPENSQTITI